MGIGSSIARFFGVGREGNELHLGRALEFYAAGLLSANGTALTTDQQETVDAEIVRLQSRAGTVSGQREAFGAMWGLLTAMVSLDVDPTADASLREQARASSGLPLFPSLSSSTVTVGGAEPANEGPVPLLLDVEIVAIYWQCSCAGRTMGRGTDSSRRSGGPAGPCR